MKNHEIARWRMHNQRLWSAPASERWQSAVDVVRGLGAIQSQEVGVARVSFGGRANVSEADVDEALADGRILRTHTLRPTWHFVAAADLRWLAKLSAPRVRQLASYMMRKVELDEKTLAKSNAIFAKELAQNRAMTRDEVTDALAAGGITDPTGVRLAYLTMHAELDALICSGPVRGKQQTWSLVADRVKEAEFPKGTDSVVDGDAAVVRLVSLFFTTRGPATIKDCAAWSSLTTATVKTALQQAGGFSSFVHADGREYWNAPSTLPDSFSSKRADLVQGFDEITVGYSDSRDVIHGLLKESPAHERPPLLHTILLDGQLLGHWRPQPGTGADKGKVVVETVLYNKLTKVDAIALDDAVARYGEFVGSDVVRREK